MDMSQKIGGLVHCKKCGQANPVGMQCFCKPALLFKTAIINKITDNDHRCCRKVESSGTGKFHKQTSRCAKTAKFEMDGFNCCSLHAGQIALQCLLIKQGETA